ncbi:MAG: membrane protein insertase YidC [Bacilli bacterium]|nr:membrane protein insertase YidC [Bacilli bacterium]
MLSPISNLFGYLLNFLYELVNNNFGIAIILFSILFRIILLPITIKQQRSMQKTSKIQGQLKALQIKYKNNPEMLNKETFDLYKREKISPFGGCLSGIVQIFIILAVFYLVSQPLTYMKKANDSNPELKSVVEEYKKDINEKNNNKTRYIEIATVARIREDYNNIDEKINQLKNSEKSNSENNNSAENNSVENENTENILDDENVENTEIAEGNENIENEVNTETQENKEDGVTETIVKNNEEQIEALVKRKTILEKLNINMDFVGLDLSKVPNENFNDFTVYIIPVLYVISSFISIRLNTSMQNKQKNENKKDEKGKVEDENDSMAQMSKSMSYMMPIMAVSIALIAPLGLALYWFVSNVLMIVERVIIKKILDNKEAE